MGNFRELRVWQASKKIAVAIYKLTNKGGFEKDFRFQDQIRSAAVSIPSNIAEGDELQTSKQAIRHFYIAKGSTAELMTQLEIAYEVGYISEEEKEKFINNCEHISHMLAKLIRARSPKP